MGGRGDGRDKRLVLGGNLMSKMSSGEVSEAENQLIGLIGVLWVR